MYQLNEKIRDLKPYDPVTGEMKVRLDANESCLNLPQDIIEEIQAAVAKIDFNRYPDPNATAVCKAFADYYGINSELVTASNGSDELISIIMSSFAMKGDKVVTVNPDFSMYNFYCSIAELECIGVQKNEDLTIDVDRLIKAVQDNNAAIVIFSNPCNPTSKGLSKDDVKRLISSVDALVVLDEAYMDFWDSSLLDEVENYSNLVIFRTASKAVGAAAVRLGFAVANKTITTAIKAVKSPYNLNTLTQEIGRIIYTHHEYLTKKKKFIVSQRQSLYNSLVEISDKYPDHFEVISGSSNFVFVKTDVALKLFEYLKQRKTAIRYMGDYIRISAGTNEENSVVISQINDFLSTAVN